MTCDESTSSTIIRRFKLCITGISAKIPNPQTRRKDSWQRKQRPVNRLGKPTNLDPLRLALGNNDQ